MLGLRFSSHILFLSRSFRLSSQGQRNTCHSGSYCMQAFHILSPISDRIHRLIFHSEQSINTSCCISIYYLAGSNAHSPVACGPVEYSVVLIEAPSCKKCKYTGGNSVGGIRLFLLMPSGENTENNWLTLVLVFEVYVFDWHSDVLRHVVRRYYSHSNDTV